MQIGDKITFRPTAFFDAAHGWRVGTDDVPLYVTGRVIYINEAHRVYTVEGECHGHVIRESYKL